MIGRRELFGATAASLVLAKSLKADAAQTAANADSAAAASSGSKLLRGTVQPRGMDGRLVRLPTLDLESEQDFTRGFRMLQNRQLRAASSAAFERILEKEKIDAATSITMAQLRALIDIAREVANGQ